MTDVKIKGLGVELDEICKMFYEKTEPIELCDPGEWCDYGIFGKLNQMFGANYDRTYLTSRIGNQAPSQFIVGAPWGPPVTSSGSN